MWAPPSDVALSDLWTYLKKPDHFKRFPEFNQAMNLNKKKRHAWEKSTSKHSELLTAFYREADHFGLGQGYVPDVVVEKFSTAQLISIWWLVDGGRVAYCEHVTSKENAMYQSLTTFLYPLYVFLACSQHAEVTICPHPCSHAAVTICPHPLKIFL
jgi:hypothetical protein